MGEATEHFGQALRARRISSGMTQQELARRARVSVRAVRYIEQGRVKRPRQDSLRRLASAAGLSPPDQALSPAPAPPAGTHLEVGVLGTLQLSRGGRPVDAGPMKQRSLLGLLALQPGSAVGRDEIVDVVWGDDPPGSYLNLVHTYVGRLRRIIGPAQDRPAGVRIVSVPHGGYLLEADGDHLDLVRFDDLAAEAELSLDPAAAHDLLDRALGYWRGPVAADLVGGLRQHPAAVAVAGRRLACVLRYADLAIGLGHHGQAVARLQALAGDEPLHEGLRARLMLALAGSGQQAAALDLFAELRTRLRSELGIEPGPEVSAAHLRVLRQDVPAAGCGALAAAGPGDNGAGAGAGTGTAVGGNYLPRDVEDFTGRTAALEQLLGSGTGAGNGSGGAAPAAGVVAIDGMPGVGKTALAVHAARRVAAHYPDGQLFIDLQAHTEGQDPLSPSAALDRLLRMAGVSGDRIRGGLDERAGLWRAVLAERRVLVVLDNAADAGQVRPLLPAGRGCLTLVTSRRRLASLEGARTLSLDVLPAEQAAELFVRVAGGRAAGHAEAEAVEETVKLCGFLPLAIRLAAARLRHRSAWTVAHLAARLRDERQGLAELDGGDRGVGAAFTLSYRYLTEPRQRLFRLLGAVPGPDADAAAASALAGVPPRDADALLESLVDVHLLTQPTPGRYRFHDLIRRHAHATFLVQEPAAERQAAQERLLDYYLVAAGHAADLLEPSRRRFTPNGGQACPAGPLLAGHQDAVAWFEAERVNLLAAVGLAVDRRWHARAWQLPQVLWRFFLVRGYLQDWIDTHRTALDAARAAGDPVAESETLKNLGFAYWRSGRWAEALGHHLDALRLDRAGGDRWGEAKTLNQLGFIYERLERFTEALDHHRRAAAGFREAGDRWGEDRALIGLGNAYRELGHHQESVVHFRSGLLVSREVGDRWGESVALTGLGSAQVASGQPLAGIDPLYESLVISRELGDRWVEGLALVGLGQAYRGLDCRQESIDHFRQGLLIAREVGDRWVERLALTSLGETAGHPAQSANR
jgi:DNA-binding SARP family transcriptional activator/tetratricopeptide (TPR) repeat protein